MGLYVQFLSVKRIYKPPFSLSFDLFLSLLFSVFGFILKCNIQKKVLFLKGNRRVILVFWPDFIWNTYVCRKCSLLFGIFFELYFYLMSCFLNFDKCINVVEKMPVRPSVIEKSHKQKIRIDFNFFSLCCIYGKNVIRKMTT